MSQRIPCTVITGFLGAGKTTLIQSLLTTNGGRRIALIVNEFGDIGVDGDLIRSCGIAGCSDDDVIELANGCICCTVADDFLPTLTKLLERRDPPDHIVIETSGLALPQPLLQAFAWPEVRTRVTIDGVITVVDAEALAAGRFAHDEGAVARQRAADENLDHDSALAELFEDQLSCADLVVLNKTDLIDETELVRAEDLVRSQKRAAAKIIRSGTQKPPADILLGLAIAAEEDLANRRSHHHDHDHDDGHDDHHHDDHHHDDHDHDAFETFIVPVAPLAEADEITRRVAALTTDSTVLRVKGTLAITGKPMRLVVQAVGPRVETHYDRPWRADETKDGHVVVICLAGADSAAMTRTLQGTAG
ncbi:MAG: cobalamin biosynthesis protein CobW [Pseudomonadota bacterium]